MKKQNFSILVKRTIFSLGFTILMFGMASAASTQDSAVNAPNPAIKYIGSLDGQPLFRVELNNDNAKVQYLTIKDDQGVVLYSEKIKGKQFSKTFRFENLDRDNVKLSFIVETDKGTQSQDFKVNSSTRVLNNVVVTTL